MVGELQEKNCVIVDCKRKAVDFCFKCRIPVCEYHKKDYVLITQTVPLCVNCFSQIRKVG